MRKDQVAHHLLYALPEGYAPTPAMLNKVGLDFDGDLGGLKKRPHKLPARPPKFWDSKWPVVIILAIGAAGLIAIFAPALLLLWVVLSKTP